LIKVSNQHSTHLKGTQRRKAAKTQGYHSLRLCVFASLR